MSELPFMVPRVAEIGVHAVGRRDALPFRRLVAFT
jgi:hypothetical protein